MTTSLELSEKWAPVLIGQPETGMGYQIATVILKDGKRIPNVTIAGGIITDIAGQAEIPFKEEDIADIRVTHGKLLARDLTPKKPGRKPKAGKWVVCPPISARRIMDSIRTMSAETALHLSFVIIVMVIIAWLFTPIIVSMGVIGEMCAVYLILCLGSLLLDGTALWRTVMSVRRVHPIQTIVLSVVSCVLGLISCAMLYGSVLGMAAALHPRP